MSSPVETDNMPRIRPSASSQNLSSSSSSSSSPSSSSSSSKHALHSSSSKPSSHSYALFSLFTVALFILYYFFTSLPTIAESDRAALKFPRSLADVSTLSAVLKTYRDEHMKIVTIGFCLVYIFLQTFAIPGAIFLSILAGPLFGVYRGLLLVSLVATTGSSLCYLLSLKLGKNLVRKTFPSLVNKFEAMLKPRRKNLFFYLLFLRISPLLPNWFISVSSPLLEIPYLHFAAATFLGLIPANYLHVTTGINLGELGSAANEGSNASPVNVKALAFLFGIAFLALIPTLFRKKFEALNEEGVGASTNPELVDEAQDAALTENGANDAVASHTRSSKKKKKTG